jgi:hypothetical protein
MSLTVTYETGEREQGRLLLLINRRKGAGETFSLLFGGRK